jgi:hypothetical protein
MRGLCLFAGLACLWPNVLVLNIAGVLVVFALLAWNIKFAPAPKTTDAVAS